MLINSRKGQCKYCKLRRKIKIKLHRKVFERIKESKFGISSKFIGIKDPWRASHISYSEIIRTLFRLKSTNNIKINITHHRVKGHRWIQEGIFIKNTCWVSQSVFYNVLNAVRDRTDFCARFYDTPNILFKRNKIYCTKTSV